MNRTLELSLMVVSTALAFVGIGLAYVFYGGGYREPARRFAEGAPGFVKLVQDKFRIDELYDALIIRPIRKVSRAIFFVVDRVIIDKILVEGSGGGRRRGRAHRPDLPGRRRPELHGGVRRRRRRAGLSRGAAHGPSTTCKVTSSGLSVDVDARRGGHASTRPLEYDYRLRRGRHGRGPKGPSVAQHVYAAPGSTRSR